jgi:small subunit ribosomal protein S6
MSTTTSDQTVRSVSSRVGTQREYETVVILRPEIAKQGILEFVDRVRGILRSEGSRLTKFDNWGLRTLAFPIKRSAKGVYLYTRYLGGSGVVAELERNLRITESVLRFLTVRVDDDVDPQARPDEVTDAAIQEVAEPGEDPIEFERQRREAEARNAEEAADDDEDGEAEESEDGEPVGGDEEADDDDEDED